MNDRRLALSSALLIGVAAGVGVAFGRVVLLNESLGRGADDAVVVGLLTALVSLGVRYVRGRPHR